MQTREAHQSLGRVEHPPLPALLQASASLSQAPLRAAAERMTTLRYITPACNVGTKLPIKFFCCPLFFFLPLFFCFLSKPAVTPQDAGEESCSPPGTTRVTQEDLTSLKKVIFGSNFPLGACLWQGDTPKHTCPVTQNHRQGEVSLQ